MTALSDQSIASLRNALGAEHAAVWAYGLASAYTNQPRVASAIDEGTNEHREHRDTAEGALQDAGQVPPATQVAYALPSGVTDQTSAIQALVTAEKDCQVGWRSVLETTDDTALRHIALDALTVSATRATRWRITIGTRPATEAFPGQP
jgi:rubrerythrin